MMKKTNLILLALAFTSSLAIADDFKLGYINVDRVFAEAKPAKEVLQVLKNKYLPQQNQLQAFNAKIVKEQNEVQQIEKKAPSFDKLSKADQTQLKAVGTQLQKDQAAFQQQYMIFQQNLQKSREIALSMLMAKTNAILKNISDKKGYDLVLTSNQLVYAKAKYDLTDQVMDQLNTIDPSDIIKQLNNPSPQAMLPGSTAALPVTSNTKK